AVREEQRGGSEVRMAFLIGAKLAAGADVPGDSRAIAAGGDDHAAIWREGGAEHGIVMPLEHASTEDPHFLVLGDVPQLGVVIIAAGEQVIVAGHEHGGRDAAGMTAERLQKLPRGHIPDANRVVITARDEQLAVARESRAAHTGRMPAER